MREHTKDPTETWRLQIANEEEDDDDGDKIEGRVQHLEYSSPRTRGTCPPRKVTMRAYSDGAPVMPTSCVNLDPSLGEPINIEPL